MREAINVNEYARRIQESLAGGALLNTNGDKFNAMVIGWGHLGMVWGRRTFIVYVREGRYTKPQLDKTGEFTVSIPLENADPAITRICGGLSGRDVDKVKEAGLTLAEPSVNHTPGIREYPLTLECRVLYSQRMDLAAIPEDIRQRAYPQDVDSTEPMANRDVHTVYIGEIVAAYILR